MSVLTMPAQPGQGTAARPLPWRRLGWVTWRQHRATLISVPAVIAAVAVFLVVFGLQVDHAYATLVRCPLNQGAQSVACAAAFRNFNNTDWPLANACSILMALAPVLIGAFAGAPLLARELETGTYRYAWTQGLGRERQVIAKLVLVGLTLAVLAAVLGQLFAWFFQPFLYAEQMNNLSTEGVFDTQGLVFPAFTLVAFAVGAFLGMLFRRIIPALAATLGVYLAIRLGAWALRGQYPLSVVTSNAKLIGSFGTPSHPGFPWILTSWVTGPGGQLASPAVQSQAQNAPVVGASVPPGYTEWFRWIPPDRFWPLQFIQSGWLLLLAVALMAGTVWLVRRRAA